MESSVDLDKCLFILACIVMKSLGSENKILKNRIHILLRKYGKLMIRAHKDNNNNVRRCSVSPTESYQKTKVVDCTTQKEIPRQDINNNTSISREKKPEVRSTGIQCDIQMIDENTQYETMDKNDAGTQYEGSTQVLEEPVDRTTNLHVKHRKWFSRIPVRCKVASLDINESLCIQSPSKIPVPRFCVQSRPYSSPSPRKYTPQVQRKQNYNYERCFSLDSSPHMGTLQQESIAVPKIDRKMCAFDDDKLTYLPSLMASLVAKTATKLKDNREVSWSSLCSSCCAQEQYDKILRDEQDIMAIAESLNGVKHCSEQLLQHVSSLVDSKRNTLLHLLAKKDKSEMLPRILQCSSTSVDAKNLNSKTALMLAAKEGNLTMVRLLLQAGADPNIQDRQGKTALMFAVAANHPAAVRLLLMRRGINIFVCDMKGVTAVEMAIRSDSVQTQCCFLMHPQMTM